MLQCCLEQSQQQIFLALVGRVVKQRQYGRLHEDGRPARRQREDETRQVDRVRLEQVEQMLVGLQALTVGLTQRLESGGRPCCRGVGATAVRLELLVLRHDVLQTQSTNHIA